MIRAAISAAIPFTWWFCIIWHFSCLLIWKLCCNLIWNGFVTPRSNKSAKMTYQSSKGMPKSPSGSQKVTFSRADIHYIENHQKVASDDCNYIHIKPRHSNFLKIDIPINGGTFGGAWYTEYALVLAKNYNICFISLFWLLQMPPFLPPLFSCHFLIKSTPSSIPVSKSLRQNT